MSRLGTSIKKTLILPILGLIFAVFFSFTSFFTQSTSAVDPPYNVPETMETTPEDNTTDTTNIYAENTNDSTDNIATATDATTENTAEELGEDTCANQAGAIAWFICPASGFFAHAVDAIYGIISDLLTVRPIVNDSDSPIHIVWEYIRDITNIVFIIFMVVVIYLQITGLGGSKYNYTIKRALPRLALSAIIVNLSFYIAAFAVDLSNILGHSLIDFFESIRNMTAANATVPYMSWTELMTTLTVGGLAVFGVAELTGGANQIFTIIIVAVLCALIAVIIGLVVIAMRQALIYLLIMISPLAFVAYLLPNTEQYFKTWKKTFSQMLIFFPMFSILFGASELAGWVVMGFGGIYIILGMAIQVVPLILSISLLKMSGTVLGRLGDSMSKLASPADKAIRGWGAINRDVRRAEKLARDMANHGDRLNPFSLSSWNAWRGYRNIKNAHRTEQATENAKNLGIENINAHKVGRRIIGRNHLGNPIYSSAPVRPNAWMQREMENRDITNRIKGQSLETDNFFNTMGTHLKNDHIQDRQLAERAKNQIHNYETIRTAQNAAVNNARSDERFYMDLVRQAAETDELGRHKDEDAYNRLIKAGAGADAYSTDKNISSNAINAVIANAYTAYEKERQENIKHSSVQFSRLKTYDLKQLHHNAWATKDIDNIIASMQALSSRGDYDEIFKVAAKHLDSRDYAILGSDFTNNLASAFMAMKDDVPTLGRLGKMINMETAHYTFEEDPSKRRCAYFTMKEYFTGIDAEGNATKRNITNLVPGTSFDKVDRTAFDVITMGRKLYYDPTNSTDPAEITNLKSKAQELNTNILSNIISSTLKYDSKSEAMYNSVGYVTGLKFDYDHASWETKIPRDDTGSIQNKTAYEYTLEFLKNHSNPAKLCGMKSTAYKGCLTRLAIEKGDGINLDWKAAETEFRRIFEENGVLATIRASNRNVIAGMDPSIRKVLEL